MKQVKDLGVAFIKWFLEVDDDDHFSENRAKLEALRLKREEAAAAEATKKSASVTQHSQYHGYQVTYASSPSKTPKQRESSKVSSSSNNNQHA